MVVRGKMDFFEHRYYRLGKILMSLIGQWPYQSTRVRRGILAFLMLPTTHQMVSQILAIVKYRNDWNIVMECLGSNIVDAVCITKYICFMLNPQKTLKLVNRIRTDWQVWARDREVKILHEYAERGENITTMYTGALVFLSQPMIMKIIDIVLTNGTKPGKFPFPAVYYIDEQKYYFYINIYCTVCGIMVVTVILSSDVMLVFYVQHICGIFAAVGHKLERIRTSNDTSTKTGKLLHPLGETDIVYLSSCIKRHNDAIEYADLITANYAWNFFFTIGFGMILMNASAIRVLVTTSDVGTTVIFIIMILGITLYFYIECYISQILMDHSMSVSSNIYNSQWYKLSPKAQKFLQLMTIRCNVPCQLTAGKMLTMSVRTFGLTFRTFMSYFACVRSMQTL